MWHEERHARIRDLLQAFGQVSVERITADLGVSRETIRRDLLELEARGEIRRVHGGAVLTGDEPPIDVRAATRVKEKRLIAKKVASLVEGGQTLFMDAGSTVTLIAEALATRSGLTIITNSVEVASRFAAGQGEAGGSSGANQVHMLGGRFNGAISATYGPATIAEIARFQPHLAILSPVGIDAEYGASSVEMDEAEIARAMCTHARRVLIAADHAKIGVRSRVGYCPLKQVDVLVTDRRAVRSKVIQNIAASVGSVEYA